ncbi:MAG: carboxymuconolactone decarboxylase family protein [Terriglobales bacterium]
MARREGWDDRVLEGLAQFETLELDEPTRLALRLAERMTRDSRAVEDELFAALRQHFDEGEMVELAAVIGLFNYFNRFNNALQMEPTKAGER